MDVSELMSWDVVTVRPDTPFHEIAKLLAERHVSAAPVVDDTNRVVGVVSEADLLHKVEFADDPSEGTGLLEHRIHRLARRKAAAGVAKDLMTAPPVTVTASTSIVAAARLLQSAGMKRMPVVDELGRILGIVSRSDLLRVYLRPDAEIQHEIVSEVFGRLSWIDPAEVSVRVDSGVVTVEGALEERSLVDILLRLIRAVDGVVEAVDKLTWRVDDTVAAEARFHRSLVQVNHADL